MSYEFVYIIVLQKEINPNFVGVFFISPVLVIKNPHRLNVKADGDNFYFSKAFSAIF